MAFVYSGPVGCDFPIKAYRSARHRGPSGKAILTFRPSDAINSTSPLEIPCNNCMGCKLEKARQWSIRMVHEARFHRDTCFITLTYSDEECPQDYGLDLRHLQLFFKRFRKSLTPTGKLGRGPNQHVRAWRQHLTRKIRYFACGEYGDLNGRPHYHAIVFGWDWIDRTYLETSSSGEKVYTSQRLKNLWTHGNVTTQDVTLKSCSYVARYVTKKLKTSDDFGMDRYFRMSPMDGQLHLVRPEFAAMSSGIGRQFVEHFKSDFYPSGFLVIEGIRQAPPKYYVSKLTEKEQTRLKRQARRLGLKNKPMHVTPLAPLNMGEVSLCEFSIIH